jgi:hypothetical protein
MIVGVDRDNAICTLEIKLNQLCPGTQLQDVVIASSTMA